MPTKFWTVQQLADFLGVPSTWIYERTRRRGLDKIPHHRFGKYVRFDPESEAFKSWLRDHSSGDRRQNRRLN